jgi:hypothetical protein
MHTQRNPRETGAWLRTSSNEIAFALDLVPFAGIAFLCFTGVLRDRLGDFHDRPAYWFHSTAECIPWLRVEIMNTEDLGNQKNRKQNTRHGSCARRLQLSMDQGCFLLHLA